MDTDEIVFVQVDDEIVVPEETVPVLPPIPTRDPHAGPEDIGWRGCLAFVAMCIVGALAIAIKATNFQINQPGVLVPSGMIIFLVSMYFGFERWNRHGR